MIADFIPSTLGYQHKIKWDMCLCILNIILTYAVDTCLWLCWKFTLNTHFLLDFIYFHETIDFSLTSVTSSHVHIWKIVTKIVVGVKVLLNQETTKAIRFLYNLSIFRPISALIIRTPLGMLDRGERICLHCTLNEVEDESHMLFKCPIY